MLPSAFEDLPRAMMSHRSQVLESATRSVECLTITAHLARERPKPASAPVRPATVWQKHNSSTKPTQLKTNAAVEKILCP